MPFSKVRFIVIGVAGVIVVFFALAFLCVIPGVRNCGDSGRQDAVKLTFWGVFDRPDVISEVVSSIPGYEIIYRQFDVQGYESQLINALAAGTGPDIFMIHSSWLPKHFNKLSPVGAEQFSLGALRELFPTVVEQDFAPDRINNQGVIYALPLYVDTLAMLYNRDIFDSKGIAVPPKTWTEFQGLVTQLRELDPLTGKIIKAAAAIGGSNRNINRATDLLSILMIQSGVPMVTNDFSRADFARSGASALTFYTKFANPASDVYTWSDVFANSIDSFAEERTAIIFNYAHQIPLLREKNPILNFLVAPLPQLANAAKAVNYANYWGVAVSNRFANPAAAWNFILPLTTNPEVVRKYTERTNRLPALRTLINERLNDPTWDVFAKQAIGARSWPQIDNVEVERILSKMIDDVISGRLGIQKALLEAEESVTELMSRN